MFVRPSLIISVAALLCVGCGAESHTLRRSSFEKGDEKLSNVVDEPSDEGYSGVGQRRELWSWWSMLFLRKLVLLRTLWIPRAVEERQ